MLFLWESWGRMCLEMKLTHTGQNVVVVGPGYEDPESVCTPQRKDMEKRNEVSVPRRQVGGCPRLACGNTLPWRAVPAEATDLWQGWGMGGWPGNWDLTSGQSLQPWCDINILL